MHAAVSLGEVCDYRYRRASKLSREPVTLELRQRLRELVDEHDQLSCDAPDVQRSDALPWDIGHEDLRCDWTSIVCRAVTPESGCCAFTPPHSRIHPSPAQSPTPNAERRAHWKGPLNSGSTRSPGRLLRAMFTRPTCTPRSSSAMFTRAIVRPCWVPRTSVTTAVAR